MIRLSFASELKVERIVMCKIERKPAVEVGLSVAYASVLWEVDFKISFLQLKSDESLRLY